MQTDQAIEKLKKFIFDASENTKIKIGDNVKRGHLRSLSTEVEDGVAVFLLDILPDGYKAYVDPSIKVDNKTHRPDILIIDKNNNVKILVETKTNMGWCRNATEECEKILHKHDEMVRKGAITCTFSDKTTANVNYSTNVSIFLVSFTDDNCSADKHKRNRIVAESNSIKYFCLFSGWYDELKNLEIQQFADEIRGA